jgi:hypothetical protein
VKAQEIVKTYIHPLFTREYWGMLGDYIGIGRKRKIRPIADQDSLAEFIASRASHVAQASLYGYLRTRSGTRFPTLFENPDILMSINIAKWHIWLACVSDLAVFTGQCMYQSGKFDESSIAEMVPKAVKQVLDETGEPEEAGHDFAAARDKMLQRITTCDWKLERDDDTIFSHSPEALFYWSPIADELKQRDELIVKNSIRFRWIEVRRSLRKLLDCKALAETLRAAEL